MAEQTGGDIPHPTELHESQTPTMASNFFVRATRTGITEAAITAKMMSTLTSAMLLGAGEVRKGLVYMGGAVLARAIQSIVEEKKG